MILNKLAIDNGLSLTAPQSKDAPLLLTHLNEVEIYRHTCHIPYPYTEKDALDWISKTEQRPEEQTRKRLEWVIRNENDELIGAIGFEGHHLRCGVYEYMDEIGYWLAKEEWGKGIMTDVVETVSQYGFQDLGLHRIEARVFESNKASARVLEKCGYLVEGVLKKAFFKDGSFLDAVLYARLRE